VPVSQTAGFGRDTGPGGQAGRPSDPRRDPAADLPAEQPYGSDATGNGAEEPAGAIPLRNPVPPRSGTKPPPRPRKKGRRR
jgi:hypothetical protein